MDVFSKNLKWIVLHSMLWDVRVFRVFRVFRVYEPVTSNASALGGSTASS
jgi:hypothetical protein